MDFQLQKNDPQKAKEFFDAKMAYTTGPAELKYFQDKNELLNIIDVRSSEDFAEGHIQGSVSLPEDEWPSLKGLRKDTLNIVLCYSAVCHLAARACVFFASQGFSVMELDGGIDAWKKYRYPIERGAPLSREKKIA